MIQNYLLALSYWGHSSVWLNEIVKCFHLLDNGIQQAAQRYYSLKVEARALWPIRPLKQINDLEIHSIIECVNPHSSP